MEQNTSDSVAFYLLVHREHTENLSGIRGWKNLKVAWEEDQLWVKGFEDAQIHSLEVKSIPFAAVFYARETMLFRLNSLLPDRIIPSLLWTPIERALPITLPSFNHHYFGVEEKISMRLVPAAIEAEGVAMITTVEHLNRYITSAPALRLQRILWAVLDQRTLFLYGSPLLPIQGNVYWEYQNLILPAGYDFELHLLKEVMAKKINPAQQDLLVWNTDNTYFRVGKNKMKALSLGSFRNTMEQLLLT